MMTRRARPFCVSGSLTALVLAWPAAAIQFDNESGDNTWETPTNWVGDVLPGTAPDGTGAAEIFGANTVSLSTVQTIRELQIGDSLIPATPGVATLTLLPGAELTLGVSNNRIGREVTAGNLGEATGHVIIDGGTLISGGSVRMSYDKANSADSILEIRSGVFRNLTDRLHVGRDTRNFNKAELRIVGSGATEIFTEDMRMRRGFNGGTSLASFAIDAGGAATVVVNDELELSGATLAVSILEDYDPANGDIRLFDSGRLTGDEAFSNFLLGSTVSASSSNFQYDWTIDYIDDNPVDGGIYLRNLIRTAIAAGLAGDYNASGSVEQGDLDLVLNNWGGPRTAGFVANADGFATGNVDQEELDRVLNNWGSSNAPSFEGVAVPEPAGLAGLLAGCVLAARRRRAV